jgi:hypothetical protein
MTWMSAFVKIDRFWFDEDYRESRADIISLHQTLSIPPGSRVTVFHTLTTDLTKSREILWSTIDKSTRYKLRRAEREGVEVCSDLQDDRSTTDHFFAAYRCLAERKSLGRFDPADFSKLRRERPVHLSVSYSTDGTPCSWHLYLFHRERTRTRLLITVTTPFLGSDSERRSFIGRANRLHHWRDIIWFQENGFAVYDWGGWYAGHEDKSKLQINFFKESFGGVREQSYIAIIPRTLLGRVASRTWETLRGKRMTEI